MTFKIGDIVRLKSGGPAMVVERLGPGTVEHDERTIYRLQDHEVYCRWFTRVAAGTASIDNAAIADRFHGAMLQLVVPQVASATVASLEPRTCARCYAPLRRAELEHGDDYCGPCSRGGAYPFPLHPSTARGAEFKVASGGRFEQRHSVQGAVPDHGLQPIDPGPTCDQARRAHMFDFGKPRCRCGTLAAPGGGWEWDSPAVASVPLRGAAERPSHPRRSQPRPDFQPGEVVEYQPGLGMSWERATVCDIAQTGHPLFSASTWVVSISDCLGAICDVPGPCIAERLRKIARPSAANHVPLRAARVETVEPPSPAIIDNDPDKPGPWGRSDSWYTSEWAASKGLPLTCERCHLPFDRTGSKGHTPADLNAKLVANGQQPIANTHCPRFAGRAEGWTCEGNSLPATAVSTIQPTQPPFIAHIPPAIPALQHPDEHERATVPISRLERESASAGRETVQQEPVCMRCCIDGVDVCVCDLERA